jgi:Kef-type K+ transport system membrane component KefB
VFAHYELWLLMFGAITAAVPILLGRYAPCMFRQSDAVLLPAVSHQFDRREGMYTTLLMSTGLTFGSISALVGLTNRIIDQGQYTILVTAVIGSAVVPTLIAQRWFQPQFKPLTAEVEEAETFAGEEP